MFVYIPCRCGKRLRVTEADAGGMIRCWNCHEMVAVPRRRVRRSGLFQKTLWGPEADEFALKVLIGIGLTVALVVPTWGGWVALAFLALLAPGYVAVIEEESRGEPPPPGTPGITWFRPGRSARRYLLGWLGLLALVAPILVRYNVDHLPGVPVWLEGVLFWGLWLLSWLIAPFVVFLLASCDASGRLGVRRALRDARNRWRSTLFALLLVPVSLLLLEGALFLGLWASGMLPPLVWNHLPLPENGSVEPVTVYDAGQRHEELGLNLSLAPPVWKHTLSSLGRGFTLVGAVAVSLVTGGKVRFGADWGAYLSRDWFLALRLGLSLLIGTVLSTVLISQARRLGRVALEEEPEPSPVVEIREP